jgi:nitrogen regulatory protein PII
MKRALVTIITEAVLERQLADDVKQLGAHGYTVTEARGEGHRGARSADWTYSANIRMEVVCGHGVADAIMAHISRTYYANYAMIAFVSDVEVLRPEKF